MKISVITVSYNSERFIDNCLLSVANQDYSDVEHIVIDKQSTDGTLKKAGAGIRAGGVIKSGPDCGIYDAMNKGLKEASGDVVCFLNTDDYYKDNGILSRVMSGITSDSVDIAVGRVEFMAREGGQILRSWSNNHQKVLGFKAGWHPPHPAFFLKRKLVEQFGGFDLQYLISADYEFMLRYIIKEKRKAVFIDEVMVTMRAGGVSNRTVAGVLRANWECYKAWKNNSLSAPFSLLIKPLSKWWGG